MQFAITCPARPAHPAGRSLAAARRLGSLVLGIGLVVLGVGTAMAAAASLSSPVAPGLDGAGPALRQTHGSAPLAIPGGAPGDTAVSLTTIAYEGSELGEVRLYGDIDGDLAPYLRVTIERGSGGGATWRPEAGPPVFEGTLAEFPADWTSGLADGRPWQPGERHGYRISVTLLGRPAAQGRTAVATFRWETRPATPA